jgi:hypothetical protein
LIASCTSRRLLGSPAVSLYGPSGTLDRPSPRRLPVGASGFLAAAAEVRELANTQVPGAASGERPEYEKGPVLE